GPSAARTLTGRRLGLLTAGIIAIALLSAASLAIGSKAIPLDTVLDAFFAPDGSADHHIVTATRLPRTLIAISAGAALAVAGALIQALTRNPLADPGILGVNAGAALFVVLGMAAFGTASIAHTVWFAFAGALVTTVGVALIGAAGKRGPDPVRFTLAGVALGAVLTGITNGIMLLDPATFDQMRTWSAGSLLGRDGTVLAAVAPFLLVGGLLALAAAGPLNAIALGDDLAASLGARTGHTRVIVIIAITLLAGGATALAGPIGFVGLMVPHVVRWVVGPEQRWIVLGSLVLGPCLLLLADLLGRIALPPTELPVGIVTAIVGAPVLIALGRRKRASGL
ncbi:iron chelate uptake ABC transporter family permease subunit, partial [Leucobacter sp. M11]|uniref:iron chelate uptake ABC transporter family permease subunit n=1 Tax=Leucobacter sp. M11 TaxID=2993565 RepID=UPI002D8041F2